MSDLATKLLQLKAMGSILRHFGHPMLVMGLRFGLLRLPYFPYRIIKDGRRYTMLARPTTTSMADLFVLREVLVDESYGGLLEALAGRRDLRVIDIGANLGSFTIWLHSRVGLQDAWCFEPEPDSYRLLTLNLANNGCAFAHALPWAAGGQERTIQIALRRSSPGSTSIYRSGAVNAAAGEPAHEARVAAFGPWLRDQPGHFDVLKLDCEGAEWEILDHTERDLWQRFDTVVAEVHGDPTQRHAPGDFPGLMEQRGFRTQRWDGRAQGLYLGIRRH